MSAVDTENNNKTADGNDVYPLALLMDELKHDDISNRVEAMKKLDTIAIAMGPERTRDELIPFLTEVAQDDEDEVFAVLADELGNFVPFVGGPEHATILLPALEILASTEETLVRDKAVASLNSIACELSEEQILNDFIPLIEHLAAADWFSSKVSACGLFKSVIVRIRDDTLRKNLLALYLQLVQDDTPMVKRAAAKNLPTLIDLLRQNPNLSNDVDWDFISNMFQKIISDSQDSVKFLAVDCLIAILKFFNTKNDDVHFKDLLTSAVKLSTDEAWRVRYMAADKFETLASQFEGHNEYLTELLPPFLGLCEDNESDVRKAIANEIPGFAVLFKDQPNVILTKILPAVQNLSMDENETVRAALALKVTNLVELITKDEAIENLLPILLNMLKDEFPDVRLNIIANLKVVNDVIGIDLLSESLLPAITELANDINWRVRLAIIEYIPILAEHLGVQFFNQQLSDLCLSWLWDTVFSIREAAVKNLKKLTEIFGPDWCRNEIISRLLKSDSQLLENFIYRFTLLSALTALVPVVSEDTVTEQILPFVKHLADDAVPNIRFNVAKSYAVIVEVLSVHKDQYDDIINDSILSSLKSLCEDSDVDVRYFSNQSLEKCNKLLNL
ncbi:similar to Saccharomyces cerevisiae YAL016W TPD3 Regulatory subunit A of the heterotrimeric protein phosphatase 2A (PP2A) [Maudiozyma barnettii]|uniref:Similar to Saccharomyces cerevisiae YAL016W TPD3 Regulatory subunit A of the heterotrimeric protein phosphatase 2A (PP2A) n=1 Tax=Maudiozyma barnettii TaxID=61262 RepID=A0A8H2VEK9_9SACH|nr:protein phosphatase 2A structural subunit TPD3 [Kazachstania barnettii]CAB4254112.1 similar to Saccharomyces cerevisiae YAL016W TPD3 Regulatory subunit A of the heterotrimeric protein phosphatase 2A (PP2A) [Kazachstania barnettii]CAD1781862.1 similar to Saccharomyces cerevisiae YAL016W TPD3 Regulatory subunit A of the heterotrimeric protein phosphatase 2A (PP2A) [Kazachstania barnettii]